MSPHGAVDGGKFTHSRQLLVITCELPRQETDHLVTTHASTQVTTGSRWWGQTDKFHAAFRDDLRVAEAGNRPFSYDPHSYASHHRKQLIGSKLTNFRQLLYSDDLWVAEAGNQPFGYDQLSYTSHHRQQLLGSKLTNFRQLLVMTCKLPRQETDHLVMTHALTQVTTGSSC